MILWEAFDKNEIFILILNILAYGVFFLLPKKFTRDIIILLLVWGFTIGVFFDFTIGGGLIDFYLLNDSNKYGLNDVCYYLAFAPFGYFFVYFYEVFHINRATFIWYVTVWALIGIGLHWIFILIDIVNPKNGYQLLYSFPVFLTTQTMTVLYYQLIKSKHKVFKNTEQPN
ncbi:hypothetical protein [Halobacillus naozhouensis]|uniref:Rod shape-determining protein MreD n=1 Tax=Halobacillus naozhouensis TaxID=554880 RepID=A0ABY8J0M0_9BACI|nr:hypothetical protein [Halobacillus naozhouensis]WFT75880.1 hypothetical protein P9989_05720 [Halobacillus naozhouensis]